MANCDYCWDGRHTRCGGRNGCTCGVCSGADRPKHHVRQGQPVKPKLAIPNPYTGAKPFQTPDLPRPFTDDDVRIAREVLENLAGLFERERIRRNVTFEKAGEESGVPEQSLRKLVKGRLTQGLTERSVQGVLRWLEGSVSVPPQPQWQRQST